MTIGPRVADQRELRKKRKLYIFDILLHQASDQQLPGGSAVFPLLQLHPEHSSSPTVVTPPTGRVGLGFGCDAQELGDKNFRATPFSVLIVGLTKRYSSGQIMASWEMVFGDQVS